MAEQAQLRTVSIKLWARDRKVMAFHTAKVFLTPGQRRDFDFMFHTTRQGTPSHVTMTLDDQPEQKIPLTLNVDYTLPIGAKVKYSIPIEAAGPPVAKLPIILG